MNRQINYSDTNNDKSHFSRGCILSSSFNFISGDSTLIIEYKKEIQFIDEKLVTLYYKKSLELHFASSLIIVTNNERNREERLIYLFELKNSHNEVEFFSSYFSELIRMVSMLSGYCNAKIFPDITLDYPKSYSQIPISIITFSLSNVIGALLLLKQQVIYFESIPILLSEVISIISVLSPLIPFDCDFSFSKYSMKTDFTFTNKIPLKHSYIIFRNNQVDFNIFEKPNSETFYNFIGSNITDKGDIYRSRTELRNAALEKLFIESRNFNIIQMNNSEAKVMIISDILSVDDIPSSIRNVLPEFLDSIKDDAKINNLLDLFISKNLDHPLITQKIIIYSFRNKNEFLLNSFFQSSTFNQHMFCHELHILLSNSPLFEDIISCLMGLLNNKNIELLKIILPPLSACFQNKDEIFNKFSFLQKMHLKNILKETNIR